MYFEGLDKIGQRQDLFFPYCDLETFERFLEILTPNPRLILLQKLSQLSGFRGVATENQ